MSEVIRKSITLLTAIQPNTEKMEWSATEISRKLDIPVQTVHRLLSTLEECGFVFKDKETKKFRLGLTLMQLGFTIRDHLLVRNSAISIMKKLVNQARESIYLTVPEGTDGIIVDSIHPAETTSASDSIGLRTPLSIGAANQAILAYMNQRKKQQIIQELFEKGDLKEINQLEGDLKTAKDCGIVIEITARTAAIAAPIFSWENKVVASISVSGPGSRFTQYNVQHIIKLTQKAAEEISNELGWMKRR